MSTINNVKAGKAISIRTKQIMEKIPPIRKILVENLIEYSEEYKNHIYVLFSGVSIHT